ncbi:rod shape-determining protein MreC, partial [Staphylococcus aureus]
RVKTGADLTDLSHVYVAKRDPKTIPDDESRDKYQLPSDLYIGEVTKVQNDQYGLAKEVRVKTGADLTDLSHVYVAKRDPKTIPDDESRDK